jgi:hypothetical protein
MQVIRRHKLRRPVIQQVFYSMAEVAEAAGFVFKVGRRKGELNTQLARRWLKRESAVIRKGRHWYTTKALLIRAFADVADEVLAGLPR